MRKDIEHRRTADEHHEFGEVATHQVMRVQFGEQCAVDGREHAVVPDRVIDETDFEALTAREVGVSSARVFVSRAADTNISERHSNCIQYLFPLDVSVETHVMTTAGWRIDRYGGEDVAALQSRWHVVPAGVWHRTVAPDVQNWAIVAFHSARQVNDELRDLEN